MLHKIILAIGVPLFSLLLFALAIPAAAQTICGDHDEIKAQLETQHAETLKSVGLAVNGNVIELYAAASGSWTMVLSRPDGTSCLINHGEAWQDVPTRNAGAQA